MLTLHLYLAFVLLGNGLPCLDTMMEKHVDMEDLCSFVKYRALLHLVREGMSEKEVEAVLGTSRSARGFDPDTDTKVWYYPGIEVVFKSGKVEMFTMLELAWIPGFDRLPVAHPTK